MKILVTNDDGYDAEALQAFYALMRQHHECYLVAPDGGRSCCSHGVTTRDELTVKQYADSEWTVSGTPADCVRVATSHLGLKPDWVVSGINEGGNLGADILYSGTVAAAREAAMLGYRAVAISQYLRRDIPRDWGVSALRAKNVLELLWNQSPTNPSSSTLWCVNLPAILGGLIELPVHYCRPDSAPLDFSFEPVAHNTEVIPREIRLAYRSNYQGRARTPGLDVQTCFDGAITISRLDPYLDHF